MPSLHPELKYLPTPSPLASQLAEPTLSHTTELRDFVERDVRMHLGIPFNHAAPAKRYEHSMGQHGPMPASMSKDMMK